MLPEKTKRGAPEAPDAKPADQAGLHVPDAPKPSGTGAVAGGIIKAAVATKPFWVEFKITIAIGDNLTRVVKSTDAVVEIEHGVKVTVSTVSSVREIPWHNVDQIVTLTRP